MRVQINTGHNIDGDEALTAWISEVVGKALAHHSDHITRVEVHLRDESAGKGGRNDMNCTMEARFEGLQPMVVTHQAEVTHQAVKGAADKLARLIEGTQGRLRDQKAHRTDPVQLATPPESEM